jgi:actin-related protein
VNALVMDVGSAWTKAGYAGEDSPDIYLPTSLGYLPEETAAEEVENPNDPKAEGSSPPARGKWFPGDDSTIWRPHMKVRTPVCNGGEITDWEAYEQLVSHVLRSQLRVDPSEHAILVSEPAWNSKSARAKLGELYFERWGHPAFFLARSPVLSAFAAGKGTALVIECGAGGTCVSPVVDGYVVQKAVSKSILGGEFLSQQAFLTFAYNKIDIQPGYMIARKQPVATGLPAVVSLRERTNTTESYHYHAIMRTMSDFQMGVCAVAERTFTEPPAPGAMPVSGKYFEFACGYNNLFTAERYRVPEVLFQPDKYVIAPSSVGKGGIFDLLRPPPTQAPLRIQDLLADSLARVDVDARPLLLSNVIVTGGVSQMPGFSERIHFELASRVPGVRIKVLLYFSPLYKI